MAEDLNYASVVFKARENSPPQVKKEDETVYDQVKVKNEANTNAGKTKADDRPRHQLFLGCALGLCVVLLLGSIAAIVWLTSQRMNVQDGNGNRAALNHNLTVRIENLTQGYTSLENMVGSLTTQNQNLTTQNQELKTQNRNLTTQNQNLTTQNQNLTSQNQDLTTQNQNLTTQNQNLTSQNQDLTTQNQNLTSQNRNLTTQNQDLTTQNQELETQRNNLTEQIQQMESAEANISRAEWAIGQYCYQAKGETSCHSCQKGWLLHQQSCYAYNNEGNENWEDAQKDCKGKISDLAVAQTEAEKNYLKTISPGSSGNKGYWIGLRVVEGKWKWLDGSVLTETSWIDPPAPTAGHCAISVQTGNVWKSVNCGNTNQWICEKTTINPSTGQ